MANTQDLLGSLLRRGLTPSSSSRIEHSLGENGIGGLGGILEQLGLAPAKATAGASASSASESAGGAAAATRAATGCSAAAGGAAESPGDLDPLTSLGQLAKSIFGEGAQGKSLAAGGLGALAGAILGGGSAKGAIKGGALALLGSIALQALRGAQQKTPQQGGLGTIDPASQLAAGLRAPTNDREEQEVSSIADLTVKAMINAAKVDGRIDEDEMQKFVGELQEDGLSQAERDYLLAEVRKPLSTAEIVRAVPNQQVAAQVYAASLLAIEVDTEAERRYLETLARDLKLDSRVTRQIHATLGV